MRVIRVTRPNPKTGPKNTPSPSLNHRQYAKRKRFDEDLMNNPIDSRKRSIMTAPDSPSLREDDDFSLPLHTLVGRKLPTAHEKVRREEEEEIQTLKEMLKEIELSELKPKRTYRLSKRLNPPIEKRYCPEKYMAERAYQQILHDHTGDTPNPYSLIRQYPNNLSIKHNPLRPATTNFRSRSALT